jgi:hypothetical protein
LCTSWHSGDHGKRESSKEQGLLHWRSLFRRDLRALGWRICIRTQPAILRSITLDWLSIR